MDYWSKKEINKQHAVDHLAFVCRSFSKEIAKSIENTEIYTEDDCRKFIIYNLECEDDMSYMIHAEFDKKGIVESILDRSRLKNKIAILNFASYKHPGGSYLDGSSAQEESICHSSTLFPVLESFNDTFYNYNRENKNKALYTNRLLYSPNIVVIDEYTGKTVLVDVITMAAPNRGAALKNGVSEEEVEACMRERIICTLGVAKEHNVKTLFLGAYGCGVFKNNPDVVSRIFTEEMKKYPDMNYVFPIPDETNYKIFSDSFIDLFTRGLLEPKYKTEEDKLSIKSF